MSLNYALIPLSLYPPKPGSHFATPFRKVQLRRCKFDAMIWMGRFTNTVTVNVIR